ncbi:MAG TPA: peptidase S41, partial [Bacteroidales bacterium]|nr:peptidase S41 [Bacteroidales bacterium]
MKNHTYSTLFSPLFLLVLCLTICAGNNYAQQHDPKKTENKFAAALQIIRLQYVDTTNEEKLTEVAIRSMLKELDPHSVYMSKQEIDKANEPLLGNFEGIGVQFNI